MRSFLSDEAIARLIEEDVPYLDLTTFALGIAKQPGSLAFYARHPMVVCATEEAVKVIEKCGADVQVSVASGVSLEAQALILKATGDAEALHIAWRIALNLLEYASGIATRTAAFVRTAKACHPTVSVVTTRKAFPGTRSLMMKAIIAGGALPHRLGLSESILIFKQHLVYLGGMAGLLERLPGLKQTFQEKKIAVEVETLDDAWAVAATGVDLIQLDKVPLETLKTFVPTFKQRYPAIKLAAAGGITFDNVQAYAETKIDLLVTSALYFGKPGDIAAKMTLL
ncbi:MAG: ModD protein [Leptolyngbya sp. SIO1E4]|nr:ModD protein [Leptolyngbya sp. SIO1E4]